MIKPTFIKKRAIEATLAINKFMEFKNCLNLLDPKDLKIKEDAEKGLSMLITEVLPRLPEPTEIYFILTLPMKAFDTDAKCKKWNAGMKKLSKHLKQDALHWEVPDNNEKVESK